MVSTGPRSRQKKKESTELNKGKAKATSSIGAIPNTLIHQVSDTKHESSSNIKDCAEKLGTTTTSTEQSTVQHGSTGNHEAIVSEASTITSVTEQMNIQNGSTTHSELDALGSGNNGHANSG